MDKQLFDWIKRNNYRVKRWGDIIKVILIGEQHHNPKHIAKEEEIFKNC